MFSIAYQVCPVILECLKGRHSELINGQMALENMFKRFFDNLDKLPTILKIMCILHRAMQDEDISKWVAEGLKQDEHLIFQCTRQYVSEGNEIIFFLITIILESRQLLFVQGLYLDYIKYLLNFILHS